MPRGKKQSSKSSYTVLKPTIDELVGSRDQAIRVSTDFLKLDVATALTFTGIAFTSEKPEVKERNRHSARRAYDTVTHLLGKIQVSESDAQVLKGDLRRLKSEL